MNGNYLKWIYTYIQVFLLSFISNNYVIPSTIPTTIPKQLLFCFLLL